MTRNINSRNSIAIRVIRRALRRGRGEDGGSIVEMALVCAFVYLPILFGTFEVSYGLYIYNYVCSVAHQATRYAAVRGANSCVIQSNFADCNLSPGGSQNSNPASTSGTTTLQNYVQGMNYMGIDPNKLTVTATWYTESFDNSSGFSVGSWDSSCTSTNINNSCNNIGNSVQVAVVYNLPLNIPFWRGGRTIPITGVSKMMISE